MSGGEALTPVQVEDIKKAVRNAEAISGFTFSVFVGISEEESRHYAERLHSSLADPERSVLVMCDPEFRRLEIVTGSETRRTLDDVECGLAAASMQSSFAGGDIVGGLIDGIQQLGDSARALKNLHVKG